MNKLFYIFSVSIILLLTSCSNYDYTNAIPNNNTALIAVNAQKFVSEQSPFSSLLIPFADTKNSQLKGIDLRKDIYLFASEDGNLGLCAPMSDSDIFDDFFKRLNNLGVIKKHTQSDDKTFYTLKDQWVIGYNDCVLLDLGAVTGADAEAKLIRKIRRLMERSAEQSIKKTKIWQHLEKRKSRIRMVAQAGTLPEQIPSTLTLEVPKGTDPDDILLEADLTYNEETLLFTGSTYSYNPNINQSF